MIYKITGAVQKKFYWEDGNSEEPVRRYEKNPIIRRNDFKPGSRVFNSGVAAFGGKFVGVFRCEGGDGLPQLYCGWSDNAVDWKIAKEKIEFVGENGEKFQPYYSYDPRLVEIEGVYYIIWCTDIGGCPTLGIAITTDFNKFVRMPHGFLPFNRNGVLFPEKIDGKFMMLSRPSDNGHTPFGDIYISESPDLRYWGNHKLLMKKTINGEWWESVKIGAGPAPIKTNAGWILFYHGVTGTCNGFVYSMGAALLDLKDPSKVVARSDKYLLTPETPYETTGFVPNVIFPCGALCDGEGRITLFYGAADTCLAVAFTTADAVIKFIKENNGLK